MQSAAENDSSSERLKAEGFPVAPIIEAVMDVQFEGGLSPGEVMAVVEAVGAFYANRAETRQTGFVYDVATETVDIQAGRSMFRLEATDGTEVALIRPDGFGASQMAPYKSWELLFERFRRDWQEIERVLGARRAARLGVRYINRIDVPVGANGAAEHELYLVSHIALPASIPAVMDFYLRFATALPEIGARAIIQSAVMPQAVEGKVSFALDIDIEKTEDLAENLEGLLDQLSSFQAPKNSLYRQLLTDKALGEFR